MAKSSSHNPSSLEITPKEEPVTLDRPERPYPFLPADQIEFTFDEIAFTTNNKVALLYPSHPNSKYFREVSDFISKCYLKEAFTKALTQYKEYLCEFLYTAKTLDDSKIWVFTPTSGIRGDICGKTGGLDQISNKDATILYCLPMRFISLLLEYMMPEYDNEELTINPTQVFSVHNWALKPNQTEGPPFTDHIKALPRRVWCLPMMDSHTGNHLKDSFMPLETIRRSMGDLRLTYQMVVQIVDLSKAKLACCIALYLLSPLDWAELVRLESIYRADGEFNFLPEGGLDENRSSMKYVNNEALVINAEPISAVHSLDIAENIMDSQNTSFEEEDPHRKAQKVPAQASKVADETSTPLDVDSDPDIHDKPDPSTICSIFVFSKNLIKQYLREISIEQLCHIHDKAYMRQAVLDNVLNEMEKKCNEALQDLDKNPLVSDMRAEIETLQSRVNGLYNVDSLRHDRAAVVERVIPDAAMKLILSDEMEEMSGYRPSSKEEYDRAGNDLADAPYPFLVELTADPHASVEQLLSKKPQSLQSKHLFSSF
ncbi:hypothetical protein Tco_0407916 [Tanacetum coccineum]